MSAPNSMHSDARNIHIASFVFGSPVEVACSSCDLGARRARA